MKRMTIRGLVKRRLMSGADKATLTVGGHVFVSLPFGKMTLDGRDISMREAKEELECVYNQMLGVWCGGDA